MIKSTDLPVEAISPTAVSDDVIWAWSVALCVVIVIGLLYVIHRALGGTWASAVVAAVIGVVVAVAVTGGIFLA